MIDFMHCFEIVQGVKRTYIPSLICSPSNKASDMATNIKDSGLNIGAKVGPCLAIDHVSKQNVAAVLSAPCTTKILSILSIVGLILVRGYYLQLLSSHN